MTSRLTSLLLAASLAAIPSAPAIVTVAYAGSLVGTMEGPFAARLRASTGLVFQGEPKGSRALANLIAAGLRSPDVFISASESIVRPLMTAQAKHAVKAYVVFATGRLVVAYSQQSAHRNLLDEAAQGKRPILAVLASSGVRIGRTDPALDPKGQYTLTAIRLLGERSRRPDLATRVLANSAAFPEEDLAVRVGSGQLDAGFFYAHEALPQRLKIVELPGASNLAGRIRFVLAEMRNPPHPAQARRCITFTLNGEGRRILEDAGLRFLPHAHFVR